MVAGGYAMSMYCTSQLGVDGTYFGIELGMVQVLACATQQHASEQRQHLQSMGVQRGGAGTSRAARASDSRSKQP